MQCLPFTFTDDNSSKANCFVLVIPMDRSTFTYLNVRFGFANAEAGRNVEEIGELLSLRGGEAVCSQAVTCCSPCRVCRLKRCCRKGNCDQSDESRAKHGK